MNDKKKFTEKELEERLKKGRHLTQEEFLKRIKEAPEQKVKTR